MQEVTRKQWDQAWAMWQSEWRFLAPYTKKQTFNDFVGCVPLYNAGSKKSLVTDKAARLIHLLLSPHAKTLLRAYVIKHYTS